jgi:hypothetical protein
VPGTTRWLARVRALESNSPRARLAAAPSTLDLTVRRPPTDYELLKAIYERHETDFTLPRVSAPTGVFVPINIPAIAARLGSDPDTVFGRLYHHLDPLYGEERGDDRAGRKALFLARPGEEADCVNFPLLEAVLAGLWQERNRQLWAVWASAISIGIALAALIISIVST